MNTPIAQIVALTCHGNAFLAGQSGNRFFPGNSTCQFCERVCFATLGWAFFGVARETVIADDPDAWFALLKSRGALGIRLACSSRSAHGVFACKRAGFVGADGAWIMEMLFRDHRSEFWTARWSVANQNAPHKRIWRVTYACVSKAKASPSSGQDLTKVTNELDEALKDIRAFSDKQKMDGFTKCFDEALDTIATKGRNRHGYHQDLVPNGLPPYEATMLLDACQKAYVFGGMGSWNDMGFQGEDQKAYERVSDRLFAAVNSAIEAAASSTFGSAGR